MDRSMDAARLSRLTEDEKASLLLALKRVIAAAALDPEHPSAHRISALEHIVARLDIPATSTSCWPCSKTPSSPYHAERSRRRIDPPRGAGL
jgi:hypothetical protein